MIIITGIPGSGKSTLIKRLLEKHSFKLINYGDVMFEQAKKSGLAKTRDDMRKLISPKKYEILQKQAAKKINRLAKNKKVILDTHLTIFTSKGYLSGLPKAILDILKPKQLIVIEAKPENIVLRRKKDKSRKRDSQSIAEIEDQQNLDRSYAAFVSDYTGCYLYFIKNKQNKLNQTAKILEKIV